VGDWDGQATEMGSTLGNGPATRKWACHQEMVGPENEQVRMSGSSRLGWVGQDGWVGCNGQVRKGRLEWVGQDGQGGRVGAGNSQWVGLDGQVGRVRMGRLGWAGRDWL